MRPPVFTDRVDAGRQLARLLSQYSEQRDTIVLALPRGGVPVAAEVARYLKLPLDVLIVRKLGVPGHEELAMGAIASGDVRILNQGLLAELRLTKAAVDEVVRRETHELHRREQVFRGARPPLQLAGQCVILVDDGLATGSTMAAAIVAVQQQGARRVVVAVPVTAVDSASVIGSMVQDFVAVHRPEPFWGVGAWYNRFDQTDDNEVRTLLREAQEPSAAARR